MKRDLEEPPAEDTNGEDGDNESSDSGMHAIDQHIN